MSRNLFSRYIWLIDTIRRYGYITREELNVLWKKTDFSNGEALPRRTFYNYRNAIEELFKISIECNPATFEYYINNGDEHNESVTDWLLNAASMSNVLTDAREVSHKVFLEDVPSSRFYLESVLSALKEQRTLVFTYCPFSRSNPTRDVVIEPYFIKLFKQRWYVIGRNVKEDSIKTYSLDRMSDAVVGADSFEVPEWFDAEEYFSDTFGIVYSRGEPKQVAIRTDSRQAKYFRALPLHSSQKEMVHDDYSIFTYKLKLTQDFVQELLSYGPHLTVISPPELRAMMVTNLEESLRNYKGDN
ncbi:MAG: WYL domain-containing protein [Paramuribaculum sp.]|nr:WYL domain-containing protein [Paramuribaculum sp.]MDE6460295.1 WYL domain-containing protein [Paramuribaculum sp.]